MSRAELSNELADGLLADFLDESRQLLDRLNEDLLELEASLPPVGSASLPTDLDRLNRMFRAAHSLKGLSAMLGLSEINQLTHRVENVFEAARRNELELSPAVVELLFQAVDGLVALRDGLADGSRPDANIAEISTRITAVLNQTNTNRPVASQADAERLLEELATLDQPSPVPTAPANRPVALLDPLADVVDETEIPPKYLAIFIDETLLSLDTLSESLLAADGQTPPATEALLIIAHRIKGSAAAVGLKRAAKLAHHMEDVLQSHRESRQALLTVHIDLFLRCLDALRTFVEGLRRGAPKTEGFAGLIHELRTLDATEAFDPKPIAIPPATSPAAVAPNGASTPVEEHSEGLPARFRDAIAKSAPAGRASVAGHVRFLPGFPLITLKAQLICEKLARIGELFYCEPAFDQLEVLETIEELTFGLITDAAPELLRGQLFISGVQTLHLESLAPQASHLAVNERPAPTATRDTVVQPQAIARGEVVAKPATAAPTPSADAEASAKPSETLRVDIDRLDDLMNLTGQLVINKARFARIGDHLKLLPGAPQVRQPMASLTTGLGKLAELTGGDALSQASAGLRETVGSHVRRMQADFESLRKIIDVFCQARHPVNDLLEAVHHLDRISDGLQKGVMDTRMVPIGPLFNRFRRVIRDITRGNGKEVTLVIRGDKTELDKRMIDELGDPLIHMVRNSADHGIELPEERVAAGKPRQGTVTLDAFHRGNSIVIQVSDDGRGLNVERIRDKALEKGLLTAADAERMTPEQIYPLIWEAGLSTAEKVTEISGRGMGMDIVKSKIEELSGSVELTSTPGQGTTFTIRLPLTLAILPSLLAEIQGDIFAVPVESVVEIVRVEESQLGRVHGRRVATVRGRVISVVQLDEVISWNTPPRMPPSQGDGRVTLVVLGTPRRELGLQVERLLGEENIVIKSLAENYRNVEGIAGASILGDGRVSLILDVSSVVELAARNVAPILENAR